MDGSLTFETRDSGQEAPCEDIRLFGQPSLEDHLDYIQERVVGGADADRKALCDEWREANDYYYELETSEVGIADQAECRDLSPAMAPLAREVMDHPVFQHAFDTLPVSFGMVELDRLVVFQRHVSRTFINALSARLGPTPVSEALFRFCLPLGQPDAPVKARRAGSRRYMFSSESSDFRFQEGTLLTADQINGYATFGPTAGVVGVMVGFSPNFLHVIRSDNRVLLNNGYHRACALHALGVTHAPCVIETVTRTDELNLTAPQRVTQAPLFYFKAARPPLLKDYFDPRIGKVLPVRRLRRMIEVSFEVREFDLPE